jgi:DNA-binding MarR family transcriptional regulator
MKNKTVALVNAWGAFEAQFPEGNISDFCRHYLTHEQANADEARPQRGLLPQNTDAVLIRLLSRIVKLHAIYTTAALENSGLNQIEEFALLNAIKFLKEPRKTEVIYACLHELSTGTDMLNRLKKNGFFEETTDAEDRRSKRLKLTEIGEKTLDNCHLKVNQLAEMMLADLNDDDKKLCIQLLKSIDTKFSTTWQGHKGKEFSAIYQEILGDK